MAPHSRQMSYNSISSVESVPYARRRVTPEQLVALNRLFNLKSHPSREDRVVLAIQMDMELKTVTNWFQNKRQTWKRNIRVWKDDTTGSSRHLDISHNASFLSQNTRRLHPSISLDYVASLREKPADASTSHKVPLFSCGSRRTLSPNYHSEIWERMPSSPNVPPSSPNADSAVMSVLPLHSKTMRSLEWACALARAGRQAEDGDISDIAEDEHADNREMDTDNETDSEADEAITPNASAEFGASHNFGKCVICTGGKENIDLNVLPESGDVAAAMLLLGFMGRQ